MSDRILDAILDPAGAGSALPLFGGFPYMLTHVVDSLRHIILLPHPWMERPDELLDITGRQARANQLETALVLAEGRAAFFSTDGVGSDFRDAPRGGILVMDRLEPVVEVQPSHELQARREDLLEWMKRHQPTEGHLVANRAAICREASREELRTLRGRTPDGLPLGLSVCPACAEVRGECLDPNPHCPGLVIPVHCRCDNTNLCARCGEQLNERKLNGSHYDFADGEIWHTPGFCGLGHRCADRVSA